MNKTIKIQEGDEKRLEKAVKRLNRHAQKMGYSEVKVLSLGKPQEARRTILQKCEGEVSSHSYAVSVREVEIDLPEQFLNYAAAEWMVIGQVIKAEDKAEVVAQPENFLLINTISEGFGWKCSDCGHTLGRAFVIQNRVNPALNKFVGVECLKKFTGADGHAILAAIEFLMVIEWKEDGDDMGGGRGGRHYQIIDLDDFMAAAIAVAQKDGGYHKRWNDDGYGEKTEDYTCTRNRALGVIGLDAYKSFQLNPVSEVKVTEDNKLAAEAQIEAWKNSYVPIRVRRDNDGVDREYPDDYVSQCVAIAERGWITEKTAGIAASMVKAPPTPPKDYSGSVHVGEVGKRQVFENLTVIFKTETEGDYGVTTILKFVDAAGNVLTWFASGGKDYEKGDVVTLKATVKKFDEYKGVKQTVITRAAEVETKKAA